MEAAFMLDLMWRYDRLSIDLAMDLLRLLSVGLCSWLSKIYYCEKPILLASHRPWLKSCKTQNVPVTLMRAWGEELLGEVQILSLSQGLSDSRLAQYHIFWFLCWLASTSYSGLYIVLWCRTISWDASDDDRILDTRAIIRTVETSGRHSPDHGLLTVSCFCAARFHVGCVLLLSTLSVQINVCNTTMYAGDCHKTW